MTTLFTEGFELGTTTAEFNVMSPNTLSGTGLANVSFGAASTQGRSLSIAQSNDTTNIIMATGITSTQLNNASTICFGFRAKLNSSYNAPAAYGRAGFGSSNDSNLYGPYVVRNASGSLGCWVSSGTNSSVTGTVFSFPDYNWHYLTFVLTKTAANTYTQKFYIDSTLMVTNSVVYNWQTSNPFILNSPYTPGTAGLDRRTFSEVDDVYISVDQAPFKNARIVRIAPTSDVQAQFTKVGSASTNYGSIDNVGLSSGNYITATSSATDIYGTSTSEATNRKVQAINVTAVGTGAGETAKVNFSVDSGATISSVETALNSFNTAVTTGWLTQSVTDLTTLKFGVSKV